MKEIFYHALLARAAYADMEKKDTVKEMEREWAELNNPQGQSKMTAEMAQFIESRFEFIDSSLSNDITVDPEIDPINGTIEPNTELNGYDGLIFKEKGTDHYILANRGTEAQIQSLEKLLSTAADLASDFTLGMEGNNSQTDKMEEFLAKFREDNADKLTENATFTTTGHSLGSFLSSMAIKNDELNIAYAYGFNGAGYRPDADLLEKATGFLEDIEVVKEAYEKIKDQIGVEDKDFERIFSEANLGKVAKALSRLKIIVSAGFVVGNTIAEALGFDPFSFEGNMTNVLTAEGMDIVSGSGVRVGETTEIMTDLPLGSGFVDQHAIIPLTDSLVYAYLLSTIDNNVNINTFNGIVKAMENIPGERLDALSGYLHKLLVENKTDFSKEADAKQQQELFEKINQFEDKTNSEALDAKIYTLFNTDTDILINNASADTVDGQLMRHALLNRSSFTLAQTTTTNLTILKPVLENQNYDLKEFTDGYEQSMGKEYEFFYSLAQMSKLMYDNNLIDKVADYTSEKDGIIIPHKYNDSGNHLYINNWTESEQLDSPYLMFENINIQMQSTTMSFEQLEQQAEISDITYIGSNNAEQNTIISSGNDKYYGLGGNDTFDGGEGNDFINGGSGNDTLYGGKGSDILVGGTGNDTLNDDKPYTTEPYKTEDGNDTLYGGDGDDTLTAKKGNDILIGGKDFDTYDIWSSFEGEQETIGYKTIRDEDGKGIIKINGIEVDAFEKIDENLYQSKYHDFYIQKIPNENTQTKLTYDLKIWSRKEGIAGSVTVKDWVDGDFGIKLGDADYNPLVNIVDYCDTPTTGETIGTVNLEMPNLIFSSKTINLESGYFNIRGGNKDDSILFQNQDIALKITAGMGNDVIFAGNKNDNIWVDDAQAWMLDKKYDMFSNPPPDGTKLVNALPHDQNNRITGNWTNFVDGGKGNDNIYGYYGADKLYGGDGDDKIIGAGNLDEISGGSGNDLIHGDGIVDKQFLPEYYRDAFEYRSILYGEDTSAYYEQYMQSHNSLDKELLNDHNYSVLFGHKFGYLSLSRYNAEYISTNLSYHADDLLAGGEGDDFIFGEGGSDLIDGGNDNDIILGDNIVINSTLNIVDSISGDPVYDSTGFLEYFESQEYQDLMLKWRAEFSGKDKIYGGNGNDRIYGGSQSDYIEGNADDDIIFADSELDTKNVDEDTLRANFNGQLPADQTTDFVYTYYKPENYYIRRNKLTIFGDDTVLGGTGRDVVYGEGGNDFIDGGGDDDTLHGDANFFVNDEETNPKHGDDLILGGKGNDDIYGGGGKDTIDGGEGDDEISGDYTNGILKGDFHGNDNISAGSGNDKVWGQGGMDVIHGGLGNDILAGDTLEAELEGKWHGNDTIYGEDGIDSLYGTGGDDFLDGGNDDDYIRGDADSNQLNGIFHGNDTIIGGLGNDLIHGDGGKDSIDGGEGDDEISGDAQDVDAQYHQDDVINGGLGDDKIWGEGGNDKVEGGDGNDYLEGDAQYLDPQYHGNDILYGGNGHDIIYGGGGNDTIIGGDGDDNIFADDANTRDRIGKNTGNDIVHGGQGSDAIFGGNGDDKLYGEEGDDYLIAGNGEDYLYGGAGDDGYFFDASTLQDGKNNYVIDSDGQGQILIDDDNLLDNKWVVESITDNADKTDVIVKWKDENNRYMEYNAGKIIITGDDFTSKIIAEGFKIERRAGSHFVVDSAKENDDEPFSHLITDQSMFDLSVNAPWIENLLPDLQKNHNGEFENEYQIEYYDPLVIDINKDGQITTIAENDRQGVMFDQDGDGIKTATGWIGKEEGFLVRDLNKDGSIDSGKEMFGDQTMLATGKMAKNGFEALSDLDSNHDGKINASDDAYQELKVWQDKNSDGISSADELITLAEADIREIQLEILTTNETRLKGGTLKEQGKFINSLGEAHLIADINFDNDLIHSNVDQTPSNTLTGLNITGFGRLDELADAGKNNSELNNLISYLETNKTIENVFKNSDKLLELWAGTDYKNDNSEVVIVNSENIKWVESPDASHKIRLTPGQAKPKYLNDADYSTNYNYLNNQDKQMIKVVDALTGINPTQYINQATANQKQDFTNVYEAIKSSVESDIINQTILKSYFNNIQTYEFNNLKFSNFNLLEKFIDTNYTKNSEGTTVELLNLLGINTKDFAKQNFGEGYLKLSQLYGSHSALIEEYISNHDTITNSKFITDNTLFYQTDGNDKTNYLVGTIDKKVIGSLKDEIFVSGLGNDTIAGAGGDNTYIFNPNTGSDIIEFNYESQGTDRLIFEDISLHQVSFKSYGKNLIIQNGEQTITLSNSLYKGAKHNFELVFEDKIIAGSELMSQPLENIQNPNSIYISGWEGDDVLIGNEQDNQLHSFESNDVLEGKKGNDKLFGSIGYDTYVFDLNAGQDEINEDWSLKDGSYLKFNFEKSLLKEVFYHNGDLHIFYGENNELILKNVVDNDLTNIDVSFTNSDKESMAEILQNAYIIGSADNETINDIYHTSNHHMFGLEGDDQLQGSQSHQNFIDGETGNDILHGGQASDQLQGGQGNDTLFGGEGSDKLYGDEGNDWLEGGAGNDTLEGGAGDDNYFIDSEDAVKENSNEGYDRLFIDSSYNLSDTNIEELHLLGSNDFQGIGSDDDNKIYGNIGNNYIDGKSGSDTMIGGAGNDYYIVDKYDELVTMDSGRNILIEGDLVAEGDINDFGYVTGDSGGIDTVEQWVDHHYFEKRDNNWVDSGKYHVLQKNVENLILKGEAKTAFGNELDNHIYLNKNDNFVSGETGNDTIHYNKGDGQATISSTDRIDAKDKVIINGYNLQDAIFVRVDNTLSDHDMLMVKFKGSNETITFIDYFTPTDDVNNFQFTTNQQYTKNWLVNFHENPDDILVNNKIDEVIFQNNGKESVLSQAQVDAATVSQHDNHAPTINGQIPVIKVSQTANLNYQFANNVIVDQDAWDKTLTYTITSMTKDANGQYQPIPTWLSFDAATQTLTGTPPAGYSGSLSFWYWGTDLFGNGTATSFTLTVTPPNQAPTVANAIADQTANYGTAFSYNMPTTTFKDPEGDALSYTATLEDGSALPSWLVFNPGTRTFSGTAPLASSPINVKVTATDTFKNSVSDVFTINFAAPNLTINGTANADTLTGKEGNDTLNGLAGNDTLIGGAGNDKLDGGTGADKMSGGTGDDTYIIDNTGDVVTENANEGIDSVQSSITYTLGNNVENLTLTGTTAINGTGNALDNIIIGNSAINTLTGGVGNDTLDGGLGADKLIGGTGNDTYIVDNTGDVITENANEGIDTVQSKITYTLGNNLENLTLLGSSAINGTGNTLDNIIIGNSAINTLTGGVGNDTLDGGLGNDILIGGAGNDTYIYRANQGVDSIDNAGGGTDNISFIDVNDSQLSYHKDGNDLVILVDKDLGQQVRVKNHFITTSDNAIDTITTKNGITLTASVIATKLTALPTTTPMSGDNILKDTLGNDRLAGETGNDTYYHTGGKDVIIDTAGTDQLIFGNGITYNQVGSGLMQSGNDLILRVDGSTSNEVTLTNFFKDAESIIETISFETGGSITAQEIYSLFGKTMPQPTTPVVTAPAIQGDANNNDLVGKSTDDTIQGLAGNDRLQGLAGNDKLEGGNGNDILVGGNGNDTLTGGSGNDLYYFKAGFGQDSIVNTGGGVDNIYFDGLTFNQLSQGLMKSGNDLTLKVSGTTDQLTLKDFFLGGDNAGVNINFASGGSLSSDQIFGAYGLTNPNPSANTASDYQSSLSTMLTLMNDYNKLSPLTNESTVL